MLQLLEGPRSEPTYRCTLFGEQVGPVESGARMFPGQNSPIGIRRTSPALGRLLGTYPSYKPRDNYVAYDLRPQLPTSASDAPPSGSQTRVLRMHSRLLTSRYRAEHKIRGFSVSPGQVQFVGHCNLRVRRLVQSISVVINDSPCMMTSHC